MSAILTVGVVTAVSEYLRRKSEEYDNWDIAGANGIVKKD